MSNNNKPINDLQSTEDLVDLVIILTLGLASILLFIHTLIKWIGE